jgi:hypothetical protein
MWRQDKYNQLQFNGGDFVFSKVLGGGMCWIGWIGWISWILVAG